MDALSDKQLRILKTLLQQKVIELEQQIVLAKPGTDTVALDQSKVGRLSRMDALQQQQMADSTLQQAKRRLTLLHRALLKIDTDEYGLCGLCGDEIGFSRLEVRPEAQLCLRCQHQQEQ
tara:strand:+ start:1664 stop:2020 length:357 start_codon:yes stop_codon:yes gene_type:complete